MKGLTEYILALVDLAEAEAGALRQRVMQVAAGLALLVLALVVALVGAGLMLWAAYGYLCTLLVPSAAACALGLIALAIAGVLAWLARHVAR